MIHISKHDYIERLPGIFFTLFVTSLLLYSVQNIQGSEGGLIQQDKDDLYIHELYDRSSFSSLDITAKSFVVYDIVDKEIIASKNEQEILPLASLTKVMTAFTALSHFATTTPITITKKNLDGGYDLGLRNGQIFSLEELLKYTLIFSSNDGAQVIAASLGGQERFINQMNLDANLLGLSLTFTHPAGLDTNGKIGGLGSAYDVAQLFAISRTKFPNILDVTTKSRATVRASTGLLSGVPNTNQDTSLLLGLEGSKTGFTDIAGGNLAVIVDVAVGRPVVIVVLGSTKIDRFLDVEKLYKALVKSLK